MARSPPKPAGRGNYGHFPAGRKAGAGWNPRSSHSWGASHEPGEQGRETKREPVNKEPVTLESVLAKENLNAAWSQVKANDGAAGVDGLNIEASRAYVTEHWIQIERQILAGRYQPAAVRAVTIPKPEGGERTLGIPTVAGPTDPASDPPTTQSGVEPDFSESSYGFRPGRNAHDAVRAGAGTHQKRQELGDRHRPEGVLRPDRPRQTDASIWAKGQG